MAVSPRVTRCARRASLRIADAPTMKYPKYRTRATIAAALGIALTGGCQDTHYAGARLPAPAPIWTYAQADAI